MVWYMLIGLLGGVIATIIFTGIRNDIRDNSPVKDLDSNKPLFDAIEELQNDRRDLQELGEHLERMKELFHQQSSNPEMREKMERLREIGDRMVSLEIGIQQPSKNQKSNQYFFKNCARESVHPSNPANMLHKITATQISQGKNLSRIIKTVSA